MEKEMLYFASDYMEGAHPNIINRLVETNMDHSVGYGLDQFCDSAKARIREACKCPKAQVEFLVGGTQTNATVIDALLKSYQGVISADTGHISGHEAGAIEFGGHKVITLPSKEGKISGDQVERFMTDFYGDDSHDHMVMPGMVYISQPTELGSIYSLAELEDLSKVCKKYDMNFYLDGARLAYALACPENDAGLADLARLCDAFYIGGTKCGAMFGEAVVFPDPKIVQHFFTTIKQHGALLAKGRMLGIQFDELFKDDLYMNIGNDAIAYADKLKAALKSTGYDLFFDAPTNQIFPIFDDESLAKFAKSVYYSFWLKLDDHRTVVRLATSWATSEYDVDRLIDTIKNL